MKIKTLLFLQFLCNFIDGIKLYRARTNMHVIASYWPACLLACFLFACALAFKLFSITHKGTVGQPSADKAVPGTGSHLGIDISTLSSASQVVGHSHSAAETSWEYLQFLPRRRLPA